MTAPVNTLGVDYRIHDYRIERVLGTQRSSITYCAIDTNSGEAVALREYFPFAHAVRSRGDEVRPSALEVAATFKQGRDDFHALARRFIKIEHPGLAGLHHCFTANNTVYHVLQFVAGTTLFDLLEHQRRLPAALLQRLFADALPALAEIHRHGVAHHNINPRHLILRADGRWVLAGIGAPPQRDAYTAPELEAVGASTDPRVDLYAFGLTAYRCVSGRSEQEIVREARHDDAVTSAARPFRPAKQAGAGRYARTVLQAIDLATQLDPSARPTTARELLAAAMTARPRPQAPKRTRSYRGALAAMTLFVLVAVIAAIWRHESNLLQATGLTVYSSVADAQVYVDGALAGTAGPDAPVVVNRLAAGAHALRVVRPLYEPHAETVRIQKGEQTRISAQLEPKSVALLVAANVMDYQLYVDDRLVEATAPDEYRLPMGQRTVRVEKTGYVPHERTLELRDSAGHTMSVTLQPQCRQIARVEQQCRDQPLQRFREQLVTRSKPLQQQVHKDMRVMGNARYRNATIEEMQYAACDGAKHDVEIRLQDNCRLEPRAGEFVVSDISFGKCRCEVTHARDAYGRRMLARVGCTVTARAMCAVEVKRAVRYIDANPQCEDVLITDTICE